LRIFLARLGIHFEDFGWNEEQHHEKIPYAKWLVRQSAGQWLVPLEFGTRARGPRKTPAPSPIPHPAPLNRPGQGVFFGISCHSPRPAYPPDRFLLKIIGEKLGPVHGMSGVGFQIGAGLGHSEKYPPRPSPITSPMSDTLKQDSKRTVKPRGHSWKPSDFILETWMPKSRLQTK